MNSKKTIILSLSTSLLLLIGCDKGPKPGQPEVKPTASVEVEEAPKSAAKPVEAKPTTGKSEKTYGAGIEAATETVAISSIVADPESFNGKTVKIAGMVTDVCAKRGCWLEVAGDKPGEKARFKVTDGEMVFPMSSKGGHVVAQGKVIAEKLSVEETRAMEGHYAKESGRDFDPESIKEGKTVFRIQGTGAVIGQ